MFLVMDAEGVVVNCIVAESTFDPGPGLKLISPNPETAGIGWRVGTDGVAVPPAGEGPKDPTFEDCRLQKLAFINSAFEAAASALTAGYPESERLTWTVQMQEALAWAADRQSATPYLDGLAAARGIGSTEMREKTLEQVRQFLAGSQLLVGKRQRLRDEINRIQEGPGALDLLAAIKWEE